MKDKKNPLIRQRATSFKYGVDGLNRLLRHSLRPGSLLVIAGHPGAGKTTLGATMCHANALEGEKCLYFSVQEPREKLFSNMKRIGLNLESGESKGLLRFIKLPLVSDADAARDVLSEIGGQTAEFGARIVVVDSVTPILKAVRDNIKSRSVLQEFFANLPIMLNGIVVLLAEIPIIEENIELGDIEFVADTILMLTHRVEKNRLVREILIRKSRGSPLTIARVPFAITEKGLRVWAPPSLETIPPLEESRTFKMPCNVVNRYLDGLFGGTSIYISYPPDARPPRILGFTFLTGFLNDAKLLFITFRTPPSQIKEIIFNELVKKACKELREGEFKQYIERRVKYLSFNPSAFSLEELYNRLLYIIGNIKPEIVVFLGLDSVTLEDRSHFDLLMNLMLHLKIRGMLIFNLVAHADNLAAHADNSGMEYMYYSRIADVVGRYIYYYDEREGKFKYNFYLWKQGLDPIILSYEKLVECNEDMVSLTRKCVGHSP